MNDSSGYADVCANKAHERINERLAKLNEELAAERKLVEVLDKQRIAQTDCADQAVAATTKLTIALLDIMCLTKYDAMGDRKASLIYETARKALAGPAER
jgi:hypothetical protein